MVKQSQPEEIKNLFTSIAQRYELANHLLCGGIDFWWRFIVARRIASWSPKRLLDVASGNGDLAAAIAKHSPSTHIIGVDFCHAMLLEARKKKLSYLVEADALSLPFANETFDVLTVAFGLRNMASWDDALQEMQRVLSPQGRLLILDFSLPSLVPLRFLYRFYLHNILPFIAGKITGEADAYHYMGTSIEEFPSGKNMETLLKKSGFTHISSTPMTFGVVTLYEGRKG